MRELYVRDERVLRSRCASFTFEMREIKFQMRDLYFRGALRNARPHVRVKCPLLLPQFNEQQIMETNFNDT
jgi:hypothetical protein